MRQSKEKFQGRYMTASLSKSITNAAPARADSKSGIKKHHCPQPLSRRSLEIQRVTVREANDLHQAFAVLAQRPMQAVVVPNTSLLNPLGAQIAELAAKHQLPTIGSSVFARAGGLLAYGPDGTDMYRRAAGYVDAIRKGARPADLPMEGATQVRTDREFENSANAQPDHPFGDSGAGGSED